MAILSMVLIGMRGLAVQLSNPFGNDAVDFEIDKFMKSAQDNSIAMLQDARPPCATRAAEGMANPLLPADANALPAAARLPPPPTAAAASSSTKKEKPRKKEKPVDPLDEAPTQAL